MIQGESMIISTKNAKKILILSLLLIVFIGFGCFYFGIVYTKTNFVNEASSELNALLETNFSYACGFGEKQQYYLPNITVGLQ